ncbi:MAG: hypothetical protein HQ546_02585 [Planctomycetes bacterium]|nr:hypothetical protein [Planctomycetota bacterium]
MRLSQHPHQTVKLPRLKVKNNPPVKVRNVLSYSRRLAERISLRLTRTQQRNAKAQRSHHKRAIRRLHTIGV